MPFRGQVTTFSIVNAGGIKDLYVVFVCFVKTKYLLL